MDEWRTFNPETAYDGIAPLFDSTMRDDAEVASHAGWVVRTLRALRARTVVDAAAGTGAQALALCADSGFDCVVASDASAAMLRICRTKLDHRGIRYSNALTSAVAPAGVIVMQATWAELRPKLPPGAWDAICCLGFSLPHLCTTERFLEVLGGWRELLRPRGHVLLDFGTNFAGTAARVRSGTFAPEPRSWTVAEERDESGAVRIVVTGREFLEDPATPLGWKTRVQKLIATLSEARAISDPQTVAFETALLDERAVDDLVRESGLRAVTLPCGPSPKLHVDVRDVLLTPRA
jgi:SAM-dependent methyltransferase